MEPDSKTALPAWKAKLESSKIEMSVPDDEFVKPLADIVYAELADLEFIERRLLHPTPSQNRERVYVFIPRRLLDERRPPMLFVSYVEGRFMVRMRKDINQIAAESIRDLNSKSSKTTSTSGDVQAQKEKREKSTSSSRDPETRKRKLGEVASSSAPPAAKVRRKKCVVPKRARKRV